MRKQTGHGLGSHGQHQGNTGNTDIAFGKSSFYKSKGVDSQLNNTAQMGLFSEKIIVIIIKIK